MKFLSVLCVERLQINDVEILPDIDNVIDETFKIPLLQLELFVHSFCP